MISNTKAFFTGVAPGRLDVMGGIADYSGAQVLQKTIREKTTARLQFSERPDIRIKSITNTGEAFHAITPVSVAQEGFTSSGYYQQLGEALKDIPGGSWAVYVIGCVAVFCKEKKQALQGQGC